MSDAYGSHVGSVGIRSDGLNDQIVALSLPAGNYVLHANATIENFDRDDVTLCSLRLNGTQLDRLVSYDKQSFESDVRLLGIGSLSGPANATVTCQTLEDGVLATDIQIVAIKVGAIH